VNLAREDQLDHLVRLDSLVSPVPPDVLGIKVSRVSAVRQERQELLDPLVRLDSQDREDPLESLEVAVRPAFLGLLAVTVKLDKEVKLVYLDCQDHQAWQEPQENPV